jgi:hypothetical protein
MEMDDEGPLLEELLCEAEQRSRRSILRYGRVLPKIVEELRPWWAYITNKIERMREHWNIKPQILFCWAETEGIKAFAVKGNGRYFVVLSAGTISTLRHYFTNLLTISTIADQFGIVSSQPIPEIADSDLSDFLNSLCRERTNKEIDHSNLPEWMVKVAVDILIFHEFFHIKNGHIDFLTTSTGRTVIADDAETRAIATEDLTLQALEMDSDGLASFNSIATVLHPGDQVLEMLGILPLGPIVQSDRITAYFFVVTALLALFDPKPNRYPSLARRHRMLLHTASDYLIKTGIITSRGQIVPAFGAGIRAFSLTLRQAVVEAPFFDEIAGYRGDNYGDLVFGRLARITPQLEQYKLGGILSTTDAPPI